MQMLSEFRLFSHTVFWDRVCLTLTLQLLTEIVIPKAIEQAVTKEVPSSKAVLHSWVSWRLLEINPPLDCWACIFQVIFSRRKTVVTVCRRTSASTCTHVAKHFQQSEDTNITYFARAQQSIHWIIHSTYKASCNTGDSSLKEWGYESWRWVGSHRTAVTLWRRI